MSSFKYRPASSLRYHGSKNEGGRNVASSSSSSMDAIFASFAPYISFASVFQERADSFLHNLKHYKEDLDRKGEDGAEAYVQSLDGIVNWKEKTLVREEAVILKDHPNTNKWYYLIVQFYLKKYFENLAVSVDDIRKDIEIPFLRHFVHLFYINISECEDIRTLKFFGYDFCKKGKILNKLVANSLFETISPAVNEFMLEIETPSLSGGGGSSRSSGNRQQKKEPEEMPFYSNYVKSYVDSMASSEDDYEEEEQQQEEEEEEEEPKTVVVPPSSSSSSSVPVPASRRPRSSRKTTAVEVPPSKRSGDGDGKKAAIPAVSAAAGGGGTSTIRGLQQMDVTSLNTSATAGKKRSVAVNKQHGSAKTPAKRTPAPASTRTPAKRTPFPVPAASVKQQQQKPDAAETKRVVITPASHRDKKQHQSLKEKEEAEA